VKSSYSGRTPLCYHLEPDPWPAACRIDDAVRADAQLILWYSDISPVLIPAVEASRRRLQLIPERSGSEACQRFRIGAVDDQLQAIGLSPTRTMCPRQHARNL
jgi:hypothetical protein